MCYSEPAFTQTAEVLRNSVSFMCISWGLMLAMLHFPYLGTFWCDTFIAFDGHNVNKIFKSYNKLETILSARHPNLLLCLLKIPARPCTVQPHLEPEDEGGAAGRSGGGDACLQRGPWARQCHCHLLEPPGVWGLCSTILCCTHFWISQPSMSVIHWSFKPEQHIGMLLWVQQRNTGLFLKLIQILRAKFVFICSYLQVKYECLSDEIKIGDYYLRLLLEEDENEESSAIKRS